jgi:hypothetical protein
MKRNLLYLLFSAFIFGCQENKQYYNQISATDSLIKALYNGDTLQVTNRIGINPEEIGEDAVLSKVRLIGAMRFLKENGLPEKSLFEIKEYPKKSMDLIDVIVPVHNQNNHDYQGKIIVRFVKFLPSNKIAFFRVDSKVKLQGPTKRPELDSIIQGIK